MTLHNGMTLRQESAAEAGNLKLRKRSGYCKSHFYRFIYHRILST